MRLMWIVGALSSQRYCCLRESHTSHSLPLWLTQWGGVWGLGSAMHTSAAILAERLPLHIMGALLPNQKAAGSEELPTVCCCGRCEEPSSDRIKAEGSKGLYRWGWEE